MGPPFIAKIAPTRITLIINRTIPIASGALMENLTFTRIKSYDLEDILVVLIGQYYPANWSGKAHPTPRPYAAVVIGFPISQVATISNDFAQGPVHQLYLGASLCHSDTDSFIIVLFLQYQARSLLHRRTRCTIGRYLYISDNRLLLISQPFILPHLILHIVGPLSWLL